MDNLNKRIKCGKCSSEYFPRLLAASDGQTKEDCSCPVCGHGKFSENYKTAKKIMLLEKVNN